MKPYTLVTSQVTHDRARAYRDAIRNGAQAGARLDAELRSRDLRQLSVEAFIECLVATKSPQIFAESAVFGDGSDWNQEELSILGDLNIAEPGALIGFAGPRVIEQTIRQTLPEGFQRSEFLLEHGMLDMVVPRPEMKDTIARCLSLLR